LQQFVDDARTFGAEQCFLEVRVSNLAAIELYAKEGFSAVGRRHDYYPATAATPREDALVLRRALGTVR
jgi:ribosomal-protein-alanine N-acetyltransferase